MTMFAHALEGIEPTWPDALYTAAEGRALVVIDLRVRAGTRHAASLGAIGARAGGR
jgi:hypothetical protein